jgi:anti-anti-sigma factor
MLTIHVDRNGTLSVVRLKGRIVRGHEVQALRTAVTAEKQSRIIVLDLTEVQSLDAGGLNSLVSLYTWARGRGVQLKLANPSPFVDQVLKRTQLDRLFDISTFHRALFVLSGSQCDRFKYAVQA